MGMKLYVDPADGRAVWLASAAGATNRQLISLWRQLLDQLQPDLVIDVGANYGEVAFSTTYRPTATVHLVEANPALWNPLQRTIDAAGLPNIVLHRCAASDQTREVTLHVREESSGLSSVAEGFKGNRQVSVSARRLDELIPDHRTSSLLFKIDVEGHETAVLRGMSRLLAHHDYSGIVEVWPGSEAELCAHHGVWVVDRGSKALRRIDTDELIKHVRSTSPARLRDVVIKPLD
jgi:FkbM family methyltransferase